jgi:NADH dehydrogenase [ubiquinone] 1 alpha subcomplex assembly factor 7
MAASLQERLVRDIRENGPISVADYMTRCLHDPLGGYYATRPSLGEGGDFITAPLISQMFGELIGLWALETWQALGAPDHFHLIEIGPGDGTLMADALRAASLSPAFLEAARLTLIEPSAPLRAIQARRLGALEPVPHWVPSLDAIEPDRPVILIANEVLDCMPARQFLRRDGRWFERRVGVDEAGALVFGLSAPTAGFVRPPFPVEDGQIVEISEAQARFAGALAGLIARTSGAALLIDYGREHPGPGDTFQGLIRHQKVDPLHRPGEADLTVWADFPAVMEAALRGGVDVSGCVPQGAFLTRLGIRERAAALIGHHPARAPTIERQLARLTAPDQMGELFKAVALFSPRSLALPGFQ